MKIRYNAVVVSSILFTLAFLMETPAMIDCARTTHQSRFRDISSDTEAAIPGDQVVIPNYYAPIGIASLAIIAIGLVVTWAGYIKGVRWTWPVMFVIVWVWAFPVLMLQYFFPLIRPVLLSSGSLANAIRDHVDGGHLSSVARAILDVFLMFLLMVLALVLPLKTFFLGRGGRLGTSGHTKLGAPDKGTLPEV